jgi:hypoxanthine phosphoribosyltransferase
VSKQWTEPPCRIDPARYLALIDALCCAASVLEPRPDSIVGIKRSGLFPAVVLSHRLELPFFTGTEAKLFPHPRLQWPLIVDTVAWTGETLRRCQNRLARSGVPAERLRVLVMFARLDPPPPVPQLHWLEQSSRIPLFWYMEAV